MFFTRKQMDASRGVPTLLRILAGEMAGEPGNRSWKTPRCTWPTRRSVSRLFLDWPGLGEGVDIHAVVREAERLGLVRASVEAQWSGVAFFVGLLPEARRDCLPSPESTRRRGMHCRENCEHDSACPFTHGGLNHVV